MGSPNPPKGNLSEKLLILLSLFIFSLTVISCGRSLVPFFELESEKGLGVWFGLSLTLQKPLIDLKHFLEYVLMSSVSNSGYGF